MTGGKTNKKSYVSKKGTISLKKKFIPKKNILFWRNNLGDKSPKCQVCSANKWTFLFCNNICQLIFSERLLCTRISVLSNLHV